MRTPNIGLPFDAFRRSHTINGSTGGAQTDYQVKVKVCYNDNAIFDAIRNIGGYEGTNPIIACGGAGDWDEKIREPGNTLYEPEDAGREYKTWFSAYSGVYDVTTLPVIGYAYSSDGITWTKVQCVGVAPDAAHGAEDPYIVKLGDTYYMYFELRDGTAFHQIARAYSTDCVNWTYEQVVLAAQGVGWEQGDVASPINWIEDSTWYMIYEGRAMPGLDPATIGMAESADGLNWINRHQIIGLGPAGKFDDQRVVPDDIIKLGSTYYLCYHGHDGATWRGGMQSTENFVAWTRLNNGNAIAARPLQLYYDGTEYVFHYAPVGDISGIYRDYPDSRESVSLKGKCKTDFGDIRFRQDETTLDYWIEDQTDSSYAIFWVKVPTIPADPDSATIYIYYGKAGESTTSDGDATFPKLFDDFEDGIVGVQPAGWNKITGDAGDTFLVANDQAYQGSQSVKLHEDGGANSALFKTDDLDGYASAIIHCMFRYQTAAKASGMVRIYDELDAPITFASCSDNIPAWRYRDDTGWHDIPNWSAPANNTWYRIETYLRASDNKVKYIKDRGEDSGWLNSVGGAWGTVDYTTWCI